MSCILSSDTITLPCTFEQDQIDLNLGVRTVSDVVIHGRITDCDTGNPIVGAVVKVFDENNNGICHTFSGCNGLYMLRLPPALAGQAVTIAASCSNCPDTPEPCSCVVPA